MRILSLCCVVGLLACGDDDGTIESDAGPEAGVDAGPSDVGTDSRAPDVGTDVGVDVGTDVGTVDASPDTGPVERRELYGSIGAELVRIDTTTGVATSVATMPQQAFLIFDPAGGVLYGVTERTTTPGLVQIDPCTGEFASAPVLITVPDETVFFTEGLTWDPVGGRIYMSASLDGTIAGGDVISERLLALDPDTATAAVLSTLTNTIDDEADSLTVVDGVLYALDSSGACMIDGERCTRLYTIDPSTGVATAAGDILFAVNHITHDGGPFWVVRASDDHLISYDLESGDTTVVGETHPPGSFGGASLSSIELVTHS